MALTVGTLGFGSTPTLPVPSGVSSGALIIACVTVYTYDGSTPPTPTLSGFTPGPVSALGNVGVPIQEFWFYKYATGADSGNYTGSWAGNGACTGYALIVTGWTGSGSPFVDTQYDNANPSGGSTIGSFTPGGANSTLIAQSLTDSSMIPAGWTSNKTGTSGDGDEITLASLVQTTAAATGSLHFGTGYAATSVVTIRQSGGGGGAAITATGTVGLGGAAALKGGIAAAGGIALAGAAALRAPVAAAGTITLGGAAKLGGGIAGSSTIALAGTGALKGGLAAAGGIGLGGAAVLGAPGGAIVATGGLTLTGAAALRAPIAAAGTITLGGAADLRTRSTMQASGVIALGGAAALRGALAAAGTIMLGGQAILFAGGSGDEMDEAEFWAQASGLAPLRDYSVEEHQLAAMRVRLSRTDGSLDDVAPLYYGGIGYTGTVDEMEHAFWANLAGLSSTDAYDSPMPDVKALALAAGPAVP